ncbi:hypothetical protein [Spiroplasma phoeniceum]|uniref:Uncharacterized protein n=1 Tax=Spiroplasma phoeniceum P40 TaxID=1276259 RepID=A0A345DSP7_9MOLU|nr:hypothetical protein [Spiroplasma phoeniceum]AXF97238.1 hypothetical protein SDAV_003042 [Spiroplasma phoeniceum P40]
MKFTSKIKKILKKTYKSIKKGLNSFLEILGFNKKESYDLSQKISEKIHKEISEYYKAKGIDEETKKSFDSVMLELKMENEIKNQKMQLLTPTPVSKNNNLNADLDKKNRAEKYKDINTEFNQLLKPVSEDSVSLSSYHSVLDSEEIENERE